MIRALVVAASLLALPACVAAIGNKGYRYGTMPAASRALLEERVESARRVVELRQRRLDELRLQSEAGRVGADELAEAEIQVEEARIRLLQFRAELLAVETEDS